MLNCFISCSAADVNPIGGVSKTDLKKFIKFAQINFELPILAEYVLLFVQNEFHAQLPPLSCNSFLDAVPTAELEPISDTYVQSDEVSGRRVPGLRAFSLIRFVFLPGTG